MILKPSTILALVIAIAIGSLLFLGGCASVTAGNTESLLAAAGFVARTPQTPKQQQLYTDAPAYKVERITVKGKIFYAYKDEAKGIAYVGNEAQYQKYKELAIQQNIAQENYQAAEMNQQAAWGWYGAYGPYVAGPPVILVR